MTSAVKRMFGNREVDAGTNVTTPQWKRDVYITVIRYDAAA